MYGTIMNMTFVLKVICFMSGSMNYDGAVTCYAEKA